MYNVQDGLKEVNENRAVDEEVISLHSEAAAQCPLTPNAADVAGGEGAKIERRAEGHGRRVEGWGSRVSIRTDTIFSPSTQ